MLTREDKKWIDEKIDKRAEKTEETLRGEMREIEASIRSDMKEMELNLRVLMEGQYDRYYKLVSEFLPEEKVL